MSRRPGPSIPDSYRAGPVSPSGLPQGPQGYRLHPEGSLPPWVKENPHKALYPKKYRGLNGWIRRHPRKFHNIVIGLGLMIFFSRPLYDAFLRERIEGPLPTKPSAATKPILT
ncbi:hypothetical protein SK128_025222 [Halocaridina rubra]|uniref:Uncharacterized protein n=1 Tax=Halocaridina rubra TaxID=373956 RepID=A0AAN8X9H5_HALRR